MTPSQRPPTLDPIAVARWERIAPMTSPWLHEEVASRMLDRLQWIKQQPVRWVHWGAVRGGLKAQEQLLRKYPASRGHVLEVSDKRAKQAVKVLAKPWWKLFRFKRGVTVFGPPEPGSADMLWANMALHEAASPLDLMAQWHRALRVDGFVMFSCLGPDTATELREIYREMGWPPAGHELTDMHDWGDMLVQAGFAEPVMDMERITLTYATPARLLQDLADLGRNFHPARFPGLRGRAWQARLEAALARRCTVAADGRLSLTFEVIYGHALKAATRLKVSALSSVSVEDMRRMLKINPAEAD